MEKLLLKSPIVSHAFYLFLLGNPGKIFDSRILPFFSNLSAFGGGEGRDNAGRLTQNSYKNIHYYK